MAVHDERSNGPRDLRRLVRLITLGLAVTALVKELRTPPEERRWNGVVIGFVPYEFRVPTPERIKERLWNPDSGSIINPRVFGVGWTLNLGRVLGLIKERISS